jgi:hypothetical protein
MSPGARLHHPCTACAEPHRSPRASPLLTLALTALDSDQRHLGITRQMSAVLIGRSSDLVRLLSGPWGAISA